MSSHSERHLGLEENEQFLSNVESQKSRIHSKNKGEEDKLAKEGGRDRRSEGESKKVLFKLKNPVYFPELKRKGEICSGTGGIKRVGLTDLFIFLPCDGSYSIVDSGKDFRIHARGKANFKFPHEFCSVCPNESGSKYLISDYSGKKVYLCLASNNSLLCDWETSSEATRMVWKDETHFIVAHESGLIREYVSDQKDCLKQTAPFANEAIQDLCLAGKNDLICCGENGRAFRLDFGSLSKVERKKNEEIPKETERDKEKDKNNFNPFENGDFFTTETRESLEKANVLSGFQGNTEIERNPKELGNLNQKSKKTKETEETKEKEFLVKKEASGKKPKNNIKWSFQYYKDTCWSIGLSPDEKSAVIGGDFNNKSILLVSTETGKPLRVIRDHRSFSYSIVQSLFSPCGEYLVVLSNNELVLLNLDRNSIKLKEINRIKKQEFNNAYYLQAVEVFWDKAMLIVGTTSGSIFQVMMNS